MASPASAALQLSEGVELGYALVARVADNVGARALAIKGRVNEAHGLRRRRASADVDVLVEPARLADLVGGLIAAGWREAPSPPVPPTFGFHSVTLVHPSWPCEIDVHDRFPGFLAAPEDVFDELWSERTFVLAGGVAVPATGLYGTALVMALHALRTPADPRNARELAGLVERLSTRPLDRSQLSRLASATGCLATARPFLQQLSIDHSLSGGTNADLAQWELRQTIGQTRNVGWLVALRRTPPWRWPALVLRVLLSNEAMLRKFYPQAPPGRRGLWLARWWRLKAAVRDLPRAVSAARRVRTLSR